MIMTPSNMLSILVAVSCSVLAVKAQQQQLDPPRFLPLTSCLADSIYDRLSCISCGVVVNVDSERGVNCRRMVELGESLEGLICTELEDVVHSIFTLGTAHNFSDCIEVKFNSRV